MHKITKAIGVALTALPLVLGVAGEAPATAAPTASCSGAGCDGKDPETTGCSADAYSMARPTNVYNSQGVKVGSVEARWSPTCQTMWSRVKSVSARQLTAGLESGRSAGYYTTRTGTNVWSKMRWTAPGTGYWAANAFIYFSDKSGYWYKRTAYFGYSDAIDSGPAGGPAAHDS